MTDQTDQNEDRPLAAEYALGLLGEVDAAAFEEAMKSDPILRASYAEWAMQFSALTNDVVLVTPPPQVYQNIEEAIFLSDVPKQSFLYRLGIVPLLAASAVIAMALFWVFTGPLTTGPTNWAYKGEVVSADSTLVFAAKCDPEARILQLDRLAGSAKEGRVLQLWLVPNQGEPQSIAILGDEQSFSTELSLDVMIALWTGTLAISDEPVGGSPEAGPSGEIIATGKVSKV